MHINQAIEFIVDMYMLQLETKKRFSIELVGGPGIGKSQAVKQAAVKIAKKLDKPMTVKPFFLTTVEPPDVRGFGLPGKDEDGSLTMQFTRAPWMPKKSDAANGFVFLDEFGQAAPDVAKPAAELVLNGQVGDSRLPIEYMVLMASNRQGDRSGVGKPMAFIENRKCQIVIEPNLDAWVTWAQKEQINPWAIGFAKANPGDVFRDAVPDKPGPFCTPRSLEAVSYLMGKFPLDTFTEAAGGYVGQGVATKIAAYMKYAEQLPTFEEIIADPAKCRLPDPERPDAQYVVTLMIANRVNTDTARAAFKYLQRLPSEYQVTGLRSTLDRVPEMLHTPDFAAWIRENKQLVMAVMAPK